MYLIASLEVPIAEAVNVPGEQTELIWSFRRHNNGHVGVAGITSCVVRLHLHKYWFRLDSTFFLLLPILYSQSLIIPLCWGPYVLR